MTDYLSPIMGSNNIVIFRSVTDSVEIASYSTMDIFNFLVHGRSVCYGEQVQALILVQIMVRDYFGKMLVYNTIHPLYHSVKLSISRCRSGVFDSQDHMSWNSVNSFCLD